MAMQPILPVIKSESLTSYLNRMAAFHAGMGCYGFLDTIELSRVAAMMPKEADFDRLLSLTGLPEAALSRMTFRPHGGRMRSISGLPVHAEFANLDKTSFCPQCLIEDGRSHSASAGVRVGRIDWQIESVRTCKQHGIGLVRRKNTHYSERFQLMTEVAPRDEILSEMANVAEQRSSSKLQDYIVGRLDGRAGPAWLDGQAIDLAARACEMLGVILSVGTHVDLRAVTESQWCEAGDVGFGFAAKGEEGVHEALELALSRFSAAGLKGGAQKSLGRLYQWLQFNTNGKPFGPVRDVVREFILDNFPIEVGTDLLGAPVDRQRVHSVHSLAKVTGDHPKTITRAVISAGLAQGDPDKLNAGMVFNAEAGVELMSRIRNSISVPELRTRLNCNRIIAEELVRSEVIPRLLPEEAKASGLLKNVAISDADAFLDQLLSMAKSVPVASAGLMDIAAAAEASRWPILDIVTALLSGMFANVEVVDTALKFKGILVDPVEVRTTLSRASFEGAVGVNEAVRILDMPIHGMNALAKMRKPDGSCYIEERAIANAKGVGIRVFALETLQSFRREHISLKEFAEAKGVVSKWMKIRLDAQGVEPISPRYELGRVWYRKADLPA